MSGEGGMITTDDDHVADQARLLRNHGMRNRYEYEMLGYNFRLTDVLAAIGLAQLGRMEEATRRRRSNASYLSARLRGVRTPKVKEGREHVWHQYTVTLPARSGPPGRYSTPRRGWNRHWRLLSPWRPPLPARACAHRRA